MLTTGWPQALGSAWLRPDREQHPPHRYATRELLYANECAPSTGFSMQEARDRITPLLERGCLHVYLRVDFTPDLGKSPPVEAGENELFVNFLARGGS